VVGEGAVNDTSIVCSQFERNARPTPKTCKPVLDWNTTFHTPMCCWSTGVNVKETTSVLTTVGMVRLNGDLFSTKRAVPVNVPDQSTQSIRLLVIKSVDAFFFCVNVQNASPTAPAMFHPRTQRTGFGRERFFRDASMRKHSRLYSGYRPEVTQITTSLCERASKGGTGLRLVTTLFTTRWT
jgi:hypothetical protein